MGCTSRFWETGGRGPGTLHGYSRPSASTTDTGPSLSWVDLAKEPVQSVAVCFSAGVEFDAPLGQFDCPIFLTFAEVHLGQRTETIGSVRCQFGRSQAVCQSLVEFPGASGGESGSGRVVFSGFWELVADPLVNSERPTEHLVRLPRSPNDANRPQGKAARCKPAPPPRAAAL